MTWQRRRACPAAPCPGCSTAGTTCPRHPRGGEPGDQEDRLRGQPARPLAGDPALGVGRVHLVRAGRAAVRRPELRRPAARLHPGAGRARHRAVPLHRRVPAPSAPGSPGSSRPGTWTARCWSPRTPATRCSTCSARRACPHVACGAPLGHESTVSYVAADERDGARAMVEYLRSIGPDADRHHHRAAGHLRRARPAARATGTCSAAAFDESLIEEGDYSQDSGERGDDQAARAAPGPRRRVRRLGRDGGRAR